MQENLIVCPVDHKDDQIQKVTAVVSDSSKGVLGERLSKPTLPPEPRFQKDKYPSPPVLGKTLVCGIPAVLGFIVGAITSQTAFFIAGFVGAFLVGLFFMYGISKDQAEFNNGEKSRKRATEARHEVWVRVRREMPRMEMDWNQLYYCNRHDVIFIPNDARGAASPEDMGRRYGIFRSFDDNGLTQVGE